MYPLTPLCNPHPFMYPFMVPQAKPFGLGHKKRNEALALARKVGLYQHLQEERDTLQAAIYRNFESSWIGEAEKNRVKGVPVGPLCLLLGHMGARAKVGDEAREVGEGEDSNYGHSHVHPRRQYQSNSHNNRHHSGSDNNHSNNHHHKDMDEHVERRVMAWNNEGEADGAGVTSGGHLAGEIFFLTYPRGNL